MMKISIKREQSQAGLSFAEREKFRPQVKISIKREQSQAGLSFAERLRVGEPCSGMRENRRSLAGGESKFRPQVKNKLFLLLALLLTAATGAWATDVDVYVVGNGTGNWVNGAIWDPGASDNKMTEQNGVYSITYNNVDANSELLFKFAINGSWDVNYGCTSTDANELNKTLSNIDATGGMNFAFGLTEKADVTISFNLSEMTYMISTKGMKVGDDAAAGYTVSLKDGVKDADKWTVKVGDGQAQALPIGGLKGDGSETVTLQYTGRLKVKGVKATSEAAASSFTEVTTFSELQTALSAGKDVKLMNDIECTAEINITGNEPLTIDGNGKQLYATSEIRAFKVGSSATVAFKNLILTGFVSGGGPAINNSGTIVLDECSIFNCHVNNTNGGGAIENKGKLYANKTAFSGNYSGEIGGAINNYGGSLYMTLCTFMDNYTTKSNAYWGGAIGINGGGEVRLINCYFSENKYYGTSNGPSDIGVFNKPENYTIAGCTGATIASSVGDITTIASGTATLDYSDLSNIAFTVEQAAPAAAEGHALSASVVGEIVGTDGKAYAVADKDNLPEGVTAVAMVAYKSATAGSSLAIALADEGSMNWATAKSTCEGKSAIGGNSWKLPTQAEWKQMFSANGGNEGSYTGLNTAITTAGGTVLPENGDYWSSTPNDGSYAWDVFLSGGAAYWYGDTYVSDDVRVRACLAFTVEPAAKEPATVTTAPTGAAIVGVGKTTALVSGGVAEGGTMMYKVTTENTKPASTDGFSDAVPTAKDIIASGKVYVWYYVKGDGTHSDSEIAATAIEVPVADIITWNSSNVNDLRVRVTHGYEKEGVTLSANAEMNEARWRDKGEENGIYFEAMETGGYTFTAPTGKAFAKIEMKAQGPEGWDITNLGTGWTINNTTITWTGSAASTVGLLTDAGNFNGMPVNSIEFYLVDAE